MVVSFYLDDTSLIFKLPSTLARLHTLEVVWRYLQTTDTGITRYRYRQVQVSTGTDI